MRMLIAVALLLAGCATSEKPVADHPPGGTGEKARGKESAAQVRKCPEDGSCVSKPAATEAAQLFPVQGWLDTSGKGRDDAILYQDSAACQANYRQALAAARRLYPEPLPREDGTRNARAVILRQQNVKNHADAAYGECMAGKGWRRK